ncbi:hypothetical protein AJ80_09457 [Polytolypa hystricis UAMH7299]|uniref:Uncharacterized protein n=1 Tax=Polytolypa hystricis (strain UAMH7299) TaxID=1447883 RepID=A0A2B7WQP6_POLH7|nr:hypothetical protein AJ80_09457 [Polytolypa hystricis UAMH7299]
MAGRYASSRILGIHSAIHHPSQFLTIRATSSSAPLFSLFPQPSCLLPVSYAPKFSKLNFSTHPGTLLETTKQQRHESITTKVKRAQKAGQPTEDQAGTTTTTTTTTGEVPEYPTFSLDSLGLSRNMKIFLIGILCVFGTMETWFWCKAIWRWWKGGEKEEDEVVE